MFNFSWFKKKSPWILHYNAGSCNGCDIEILACLSPKYDLERFGVINCGNPKQADIFLITGPVTYRSRERLVELYAQIPEPKVVVAVGSCACTGGVFRSMYNVEDGIDQYIPVDVYTPGCASSPELILDAVIEAVNIFEQKSKKIEEAKKLWKAPEYKEGLFSMKNVAQKVNAKEDSNE